MATKRTKNKIAQDNSSRKKQLISEERTFAFIATFFWIFGTIIAYILKRENEYVSFYIKQSLIFFLLSVTGIIIIKIVKWIPMFGYIMSNLIGIFLIILWIILWACSLSGKKKDVFIVGDLAKRLN
ncbi:MAG: hypothetical protein QXJ28_01175 [Candidatus Pacearchaeota archaeon]